MPVTALNLWWVNKIMLSGLCQTLISCGALLEWPALADLYQEEQRCAMYVCMSMDYFASIAPYACMVSLQFMQIAWGVFWRQRDLPTSVDGHGMAKWLLRRGNEFMAHFIINKDMTTPGLAFNTERLMGGPVLPPGKNLLSRTQIKIVANYIQHSVEWFPPNAGKSAKDFRKIHLTMVNAEPDPPMNSDPDLSMEDGSAFNESMRNAMMHQQALEMGEKGSLFTHSYHNAVLNSEKDSLFSESLKNMVLDAEWLT